MVPGFYWTRETEDEEWTISEFTWDGFWYGIGTEEHFPKPSIVGPQVRSPEEKS